MRCRILEFKSTNISERMVGERTYVNGKIQIRFSVILSAVYMEGIPGMYPVYHEMDILQFADRMEDLTEHE